MVDQMTNIRTLLIPVMEKIFEPHLWTEEIRKFLVTPNPALDTVDNSIAYKTRHRWRHFELELQRAILKIDIDTIIREADEQWTE